MCWIKIQQTFTSNDGTSLASRGPLAQAKSPHYIKTWDYGKLVYREIAWAYFCYYLLPIKDDTFYNFLNSLYVNKIIEVLSITSITNSLTV